MSTGSDLDLRLVPAALVGWGAAFVGVVLRPAHAGVLAGVLLGLGALAAAASRHRAADGGRNRGRTGRRQSCPSDQPRRGGPGTVTTTVVVALAAGGLVAAAACAQLHARDRGGLLAEAERGAVVEVVGTVRSDPTPVRVPWRPVDATDQYRVRLVLDAVELRSGPVGTRAEVVVVGGPGWAGVEYGSTVRAGGSLEVARRGRPEAAVLVADAGPRVLAEPGPVDARVGALRNGLLAASEGLGPDARGLVPGTAIGDTRRMPPDLAQAMRDVSLTHVTAVSGAHVAIVTVTLMAVVSALRVPRPAGVVIGLSGLVGFVLLVHPHPSVLRAGVMGAVGLLSGLLGRPSRAVPALGTAAVVLLVVDPWLARSFGFVLSVLATAAIVLVAPWLTRTLGRGRPAANLVAVPLAAQAVCAPVLVLLDPVVGPWSVPANVLATPALLPATLAGTAAALVSPLSPPASEGLAQVAGVAASWMALVARTAAGLPGARVPWAQGPGGAAVLASLTALVGGLVAYAVHRRAARG